MTPVIHPTESVVANLQPEFTAHLRNRTGLTKGGLLDVAALAGPRVSTCSQPPPTPEGRLLVMDARQQSPVQHSQEEAAS